MSFLTIRVFLGHADHQGLQLWGNGGTPWSLAPLGAVKLLGHELTVPAKHRIGLDDGGDFRQRLLTKLVANRRESLPFGVRQPHAARDLVAQHAILCHQVLIA